MVHFLLCEIANGTQAGFLRDLNAPEEEVVRVSDVRP
jgi:hypothetical protein